jgi:glutamate 5-kinase
MIESGNLNIRYTIDNLLKNRVVPVINENDSVSTDEIKCGDNDRLSSLVADLTSADILILLTSVDGLLDAEGNVVRDVDVIDDRIKGMVKKSCSELGTGGMFTKIQAAYDATRSGIECYVANGKRSGVITELIKGEGVFTHFRAKVSKKTARKRWIEFGAKVKGTIIVDAGASDAILHKGKSLLSAGITGIKGTFEEGDIVSIFDNSGRQIARGVINFSAKGLGQILGKSINEIKTSVAGKIRYEAVHRDDLVLL